MPARLLNPARLLETPEYDTRRSFLDILLLFLNSNSLYEFVIAKISSTSINFSSFSWTFSQKLMGSRTLFSKLMGLVEPIKPMLTQPLSL